MIEPITYVILNHGRFGEELIKSAELIAGKTEHIHAVSLLSGMSIEEYYEEVRDYLTGVQGEILVLADLYGGTPSNVGMMLQREVFTPCSVRYQSADADRADLEAQQ